MQFLISYITSYHYYDKLEKVGKENEYDERTIAGAITDFRDR